MRVELQRLAVLADGSDSSLVKPLGPARPYFKFDFYLTARQTGQSLVMPRRYVEETQIANEGMA